MQNLRPILLVEDDSVDAMMVERAFKELKIANRLIHTTNGEEALQHLRDDSNKKPCLILLDLIMPKMNGIEFLKIVKTDEVLKSIPIVVLTTSRQEQNIVESFKLSIAGYIVKTIDNKKFTEAIRTINLYWVLSELPCVG